MPDALKLFETRVLTEWLPSFCHAPNRAYSTDGFRIKSIHSLEPYDAEWFMRAIDHDLVTHSDGAFRAPLSTVSEQIFWQGLKSVAPRPVTLWHEPVITIGALARLHIEYGWPISVLGMQSKRKWAFDLVGYGGDGLRELLLCEVKKSDAEIAKLRAWMLQYCAIDPLEQEPAEAGACNAYRKVQDIRIAWPERVWLLGPGGRGELFRIDRIDGTVRFDLASEPNTLLSHKEFLSISSR
ncbi:MAG: hypothetical protein RLO80_09840 [Hyphomonas sp.]